MTAQSMPKAMHRATEAGPSARVEIECVAVAGQPVS